MKNPMNELNHLEESLNINKSMRAGSLLAWYYFLGNHENPEQTRDWKKSMGYLKKII
jgi:hypothetical protein